MDSKLVVEQMSGRWKIKHPDMRPLAMRAKQLAPPGTTYTWIPREQNKHADRILNEALDAQAAGAAPAAAPAASRARTGAGPPGRPDARLVRAAAPRPRWCWCGTASPPHTVDKRFSSGLGGSNPGLTDEGRAQVRATADWLSPLAEEIDVVVSSPVRRTHESAEILAEPAGPGAGHRGRARRDGVRHLGRDDLRGDPRAPPRRPGRLARLAGPRARRRRVVPRSSRSGCWPASTGCSRSTPAGRCSWSATSRRSRCSSPTRSGAPLESVYRMEMAPGVGDGAVVLRRRQRRRCGCSTRARPERAGASQVADDHVEPGAVPAGRTRLDLPAQRRRGGRRTGPGVPGAAPSSSSARTIRPLVALLKCETTLRVPSTSCSTRTVTTRAGQVRGRAPERRRTSRSAGRRPARGRPRPARRRRAAGSSTSTRCRCPGSDDVAGEPVGRDPVGRAQQPEQARGHRQPATSARRRAAAASDGEVERLVEHPAVDPVGARGGRASAAAALRGDVVGLGRAEPEHPRRRRPGRPSCTGRRGRRAPRARCGSRLGERRARRGRAACRAAGTVLPSDGGSRISTRATLCWPGPTDARGDQPCRDES